MAIAIRAATLDDAESIARLVSDLGYDTSGDAMRARLEAIFRDPDYDTLVAVDDDVVAGFVGTRAGPLYETDVSYGQIMALSVAGSHQGRGVGRLLMLAAETILTGRGVRQLIVTSGLHREGAHAFYERLGYAFNGKRFRKSI
jgi:ribosomal protein S18 acetylase RimI-like enzyme